MSASTIMRRLSLWAIGILVVSGASRGPATANAACVHDVVFIIDGSGSIGSSNFAVEKQFVEDIITTGISNDTRVGVVLFSNGATTEWTFSDSQVPSTVAAHVSSLAYPDSSSYVKDSVTEAIAVFSTHSDPDHRKTIFLLADNVYPTSTQSPCSLKTSLDAAGIDVRVIGVGASYNPAYFDCLVDDTNTQMTDIASYGGGAFWSASLPDADSDGVCDTDDICDGFDDALDDDADSVPDGCDICAGFDDALDDDSDSVPDGCDICAGFDDALDDDSDSVPDGCDICAGFDDALDDDADSVPDGCDICAGFDDALDDDADSVPDGCDICAGFDDALDDDDDNIPNGCDVCLGNDSLDTDGDGVPDACDICAGFDDALDDDADGVADGCDICPGGNDNLDGDGDGTPDDCDPCPDHTPDDPDGDGTCGTTGEVTSDGCSGTKSPHPAWCVLVIVWLRWKKRTVTHA